MTNINYSLDFELSDNNYIPNLFGVDDKNIHIIEKVNNVEFVIAYSFMYSQRPGTPAQKKDNVPIADKKARLSALQSLLKEQQKKFNKSFVGSTMEVLFEKKGRYQDQYIGRSIYNQSVFTKNNKNLINTIENVKILNSTDFALESSI